METGRERDDEFLNMSELTKKGRHRTRHTHPHAFVPNKIILIEDTAWAFQMIGDRNMLGSWREQLASRSAIYSQTSEVAAHHSPDAHEGIASA